MIREATIEDIPSLVKMGSRFVTEGPVAGKLAHNVAQLEILGHSMLENPNARIFVSEEGAELTGMLGLLLYHHPISGVLGAGELFWWAEPEKRGGGVRLLKRAQRWVREAGGKWLQMGAPDQRVGHFYKRLGFSPIETLYQMELL